MSKVLIPRLGRLGGAATAYALGETGMTGLAPPTLRVCGGYGKAQYEPAGSGASKLRSNAVEQLLDATYSIPRRYLSHSQYHNKV